LQRAQSVACDQTIINIFIDLLQSNDIKTRAAVLSLISQLEISNPSITLITSITIALDDENWEVNTNACQVLGEISEKAATNEVISKLIVVVNGDDNYFPSCFATEGIGNILSSLSVITQLDPKIISDICLCKRASDCLKNVSTEQLIDLFLPLEILIGCQQ